MNRLDFYKIKAKPTICLILFAVGGVLCVLSELCGIACVSDEPVLQKNFVFPAPAWVMIPAIYAVGGLIICLRTKNPLSGAVYGAALGQCQFWLVMIYGFGILRLDNSTDVWWKALAAPFYAAVFAVIIPLSEKILDRIQKKKQ